MTDAPATADRLPSPFIPLFCIVALLAVLAWPMFQGHVYVADDLGALHLPLRAFYSQQLSAGESFDWNPQLFDGFYLTGEGQAGTYHPLHWLLYRMLPLNIAFDLECWLSYPFMLAGMFFLLRRWQLPSFAILFGAIAFTFSSFNLLHFVHPNAIAIVSHIPWLLAAIDVLLRNPPAGNQPLHPRHRRLAFAAIAILTGSQLLLGYPQYVMFSLLLEAGYVAFVISNQQFRFRVFFRWLVAVAIGALIGGIQLLSTIQSLSLSVRHFAGVELAGEGSLHPLNLIQLVAPYLFTTRVVGQNTHELGLYLGAVPFVLAVWWLLNFNARNQHRRLTIFAALTAAIALLWAFGTFGPLGWLQSHLPLIDRFRFPSRAIVIFQLATAILAAIGLTELIQTPSTDHKSSTAFLWWIPAISLAVAAIAYFAWPNNLSPWPLIAVGPALFAIAVALIFLSAAGNRWALAALIILTTADLASYGLSYSVFGSTETFSQFIAEISTSPGNIAGRVAVDLFAGTETAPGETTLRTGNQIALTGRNCVDGYLGLEPNRTLDYRDPAALRAAGVRWISSDAAKQLSAAALQHNDLQSSADTTWLALTNPQPRAWCVPRAVISTSPAADISNINLSAEALVEQPLQLDAPASTKPGAVEILTDRPGHIALKTDCPTPQLLVVAESHHPGWHAAVDGQKMPILRANGDFLGLQVSAGPHQIALDFHPNSLDFGRAVSTFGLGLIGVIVFWPQRPERR